MRTKKSKYLSTWEHIQLEFWSKLFIWSCKSRVRTICVPEIVCNWIDKQVWKQLRKIPK